MLELICSRTSEETCASPVAGAQMGPGSKDQNPPLPPKNPPACPNSHSLGVNPNPAPPVPAAGCGLLRLRLPGAQAGAMPRAVCRPAAAPPPPRVPVSMCLCMCNLAICVCCDSVSSTAPSESCTKARAPYGGFLPIFAPDVLQHGMEPRDYENPQLMHHCRQLLFRFIPCACTPPQSGHPPNTVE